jgi:hypothetical protein
MTAVNAFARADGGWLLVDTASYDHYGNILAIKGHVGHEGKVAVSVGHCVAIATSGRVAERAVEDIEGWLDQQPDQAAALGNIAELLRVLLSFDAEASANGAEQVSGPIPAGIKLALAWWDHEARRGATGIIVSDTALAPGLEPFRLAKIGTMFSPPLIGDPWPGHTFDPRNDAERMAKLQRCVPDEDGIYRVGGAFEAYRVHADGIEHATVVRWRDSLGKPINPHQRAGLLERVRSRVVSACRT